MPSAPPATETRNGPAFLRALDHVHPTETGWLAACPFWGCGNLLLIDPVDGHWQFYCDAGHTHDDICRYLALEDLRVDTGPSTRLWRAIMLSPRLEVCEALLRGQHVPRSALDPLWAKRFGL